MLRMIETQSSIDEFAHTAWRNDAVGPDKRTLKDACYLLLNCSLFSGLSPDERAEVKELLLAMIQPGEVFGEFAALDGKERSADARQS
jgi:hypothetical protein